MNYHILKKKHILNSKFDFIHLFNKSLIFIKSFYGILFFHLPSFYYIKSNKFEHLFLFISRHNFKSFLSNLNFKYNNLFLTYFVKIKIRGLGFRIRKITNSLYYFFFNITNYYYFNVPKNILLKFYKKRLLLFSNNWSDLKLLLANLLLLKKLGPYNLQGLRLPRSIILLKKGGKIL